MPCVDNKKNDRYAQKKDGAKAKLKFLEKRFKDRNLMINILVEMDKDHIGDNRQKMFLFFSGTSGKLKPDYRFSSAIIGDSSEGKDNLWKAVKKHLPKGLYLDLTRITGSSLEDDIQEYNVIYIGEGNFDSGVNASIIDQVKQLTEDGMRIKKKDIRKGFTESRDEIQPRKVIIYSTTKDSSDKELSTRYCVLSVHGNPTKYSLVNKDTLQKASDIYKQIEEQDREEKPSWIAEGLSMLTDYDIILIPYAELLEVDSRDPRSQRDLKRLLNLIRSITWVCQLNRVRLTYKGKDILVSSPEDLYNALEIGEEIFNQTYSELEPRLKRIINSYHSLVKRGITKASDNEKLDSTLQWVDRSIIQTEAGIKKRDTIRGHIETLTNMGYLTYENVGNRCYVAEPTNLPTNNPLIQTQKLELYSIIDKNWDDILSELLGRLGSVINGLKDWSKTALLSVKHDRPTISLKNAAPSIISDLKKQVSDKIGRSKSVG